MINRQNYRLVKHHLNDLREVRLLSRESLNRYWFYLRHLLLWADEVLLSKSPGIRPTFPAYVSSLPGKQRNSHLATTTQKKIIASAKRFFQWAKTHNIRDLRSLPPAWIETLHHPNTSHNAGKHIFVTLDDVIQLAALPVEKENLALRRDQAASAMLFLTGMRAGAFATLPISAVNITTRSIDQWPELGVKTKNGKKATTFLLPIPELLEVVQKWDSFIRARLPGNARWYPPIDHAWGEQWLSTKTPGENRPQAINKRLRLLSRFADLPYKSAHKFRHGHAVYGLQHARTMADYKAVSMNMMHANIKITDQIYAPILDDEVQRRITGLSGAPTARPDDDLQAYFGSLSDADLSIAIQIAAERMAR